MTMIVNPSRLWKDEEDFQRKVLDIVEGKGKRCQG
jgi:hypothetical protein